MDLTSKHKNLKIAHNIPRYHVRPEKDKQKKNHHNKMNFSWIAQRISVNKHKDFFFWRQGK